MRAVRHTELSCALRSYTTEAANVDVTDGRTAKAMGILCVRPRVEQGYCGGLPIRGGAVGGNYKWLQYRSRVQILELEVTLP
jgi:hypothetical protein